MQRSGEAVFYHLLFLEVTKCRMQFFEGIEILKY